MLQSLKRGIGGLTRFSGRDRRGLFWPYALVVVFGSFFGFGAVMSSLVWSLFEATASGSVSPIQGLAPFMLMIGVVVIVIIALLAAAVTRRLHDTGRSGLWGLPPIILLALASVLFPFAMNAMWAGEHPDLRPFILAFANNLLYLAALALLIVFLVMPGKKEANRYGPPPA